MDQEAWKIVGAWIERGGIVGLLSSALVAIVAGYLVPRYEYRARIAERDKATDLLQTTLKANEQLVNTIEDLKDQISRLMSGWRPPRQ